MKSKMKIAYIGLGANLGNARQTLLTVWQEIGKIDGLRTVCLSSPYTTEPVGMESTNWFTNAVGVLETSLSPYFLLAQLLQTEIRHGRCRGVADKKQHQDRPLDLDILLFDDMILQDEHLVLPHPEMDRRQFVLTPLAEIAPDCFHPILQQTASKMLSLLTGHPAIQKIRKMSW